MSTLQASLLRPARMLTSRTLVSRGGLAFLIGVVALDLLARSILPFGIAASQTSAEGLGRELRLLLFGGLTLLVLVRAARWRPILRGSGAPSVVFIVSLSGLYLVCIGYAFAALPDRLLFGRNPEIEWLEVGAAIWLATLAGILALSRLDPRPLGSAFVLLGWWVPVLGLPIPVAAGAVGEGMSRTPWSADGILPMLVPHLLAVGYVCLERAQR